MPHTTLAPAAIFILACTSLASPALAQDLVPKASPQPRMIAIVNATVHPISGPALERGAVVFDKGLITGVLDSKAFAEWQAANKRNKTDDSFELIDAEGKHVYPGFVAAYTQLGLTEVQSVAATNDLSEVGNITPEVEPNIAVNPDSTLLPVTRRNGILTAGIYPNGGLIPGQIGAIRLDGWTIEEMRVKPDRGEMIGLVVQWPRVRPIRSWWIDTSEEEQLKRIRENLSLLDKTFDTALAYATERAAQPNAPIDLRWEAMRPLFTHALARDTSTADRAKLQVPVPLFVEANDADQIASAITFCEQRKLRCVIVGGREADRVAVMLKRTNTMVIIRGVQNMPQRDDSAYDDAYTLPKRLHDAGIEFAISHNDDTAHERNLPYGVATAVAFGLPREQAIRAITLNPARILGIDAKLGSLDVGKAATLFISSGDPLEVTSDVELAFIDGREVDLRSKQTELARKYLQRYKQTGDIK